MIVGAGTQLPYLIVKRLNEPHDFMMYSLPNEARGIEQLTFLTDRLLLGYISEGVFYLVDLGQKEQQKL